MAKEENEGAVTTESIQKAQADYKGDSHFDLVEVEIIKDGSFYKKGDKDKVHPTMELILKAKGLVK